MYIIPQQAVEGKTRGCLLLVEPLLEALHQVIEEGEKAIVDDPQRAVDVSVSGRRRARWLGHTASLVPWQAPPSIAGILHLFVLLAVLPQVGPKVTAPDRKRRQYLALACSRQELAEQTSFPFVSEIVLAHMPLHVR